MGRSEIGGQLSAQSVHHGRTLLAAQNDNMKEEQMNFIDSSDFEKTLSTLERLEKSMEAWSKQDTVSSSKDLMLFKGQGSMCPTYFNITESQR